jgi:hypothetical protein
MPRVLQFLVLGIMLEIVPHLLWLMIARARRALLASGLLRDGLLRCGLLAKLLLGGFLDGRGLLASGLEAIGDGS